MSSTGAPPGGSPRTIVVNPSGAPTNSLSFALPPGVGIDVESVLAAIDASAAGDTTATLSIADSSGAVIARKAQGQVVTGGVVGSATWALRLTDDGGSGFIAFDTYPQDGDWLYVATTGSGGPQNDGMEFVTKDAGGNVQTDVQLGGGGLSGSAFGFFDVDVHGVGNSGIILETRDTNNSGIGLQTVGTNNAGITIDAKGAGNSGVTINARDGGIVTIRSFGGGGVMIQTSPAQPLAFFGGAGATRQATPVTLANVIALLQAYGLCP